MKQLNKKWLQGKNHNILKQTRGPTFFFQILPPIRRLTLIWANAETLILGFVPFDEIDKLIQLYGIKQYSFLFCTEGQTPNNHLSFQNRLKWKQIHREDHNHKIHVSRTELGL